MEKFILIVRIPEHFHAEDELSNLLQDEGMLSEFEEVIANTVKDWVTSIVEKISWDDVEVELKIGEAASRGGRL